MARYLLYISALLALYSCNSTSGEVNPIIQDNSSVVSVSDTNTVIDLNSGQRVRININPKNDVATNDETGEIVRIYVNPVTKDTFDGVNGRKVNHAIVKTSLGTYGINMTRVKIEERSSSSKNRDVADGR